MYLNHLVNCFPYLLGHAFPHLEPANCNVFVNDIFDALQVLTGFLLGFLMMDRPQLLASSEDSSISDREALTEK